MSTPEERISQAFKERFRNFDIRIEPTDVTIGAHREIRHRGWLIRYKVVADDAGSPSLEYYATHRMTSDTHVRIWADGHAESLDAIWEFVVYDANVPGSEEEAHRRYLEHNRMVADELRAAGLYPEGDINAYLRTGGEVEDQG